MPTSARRARGRAAPACKLVFVIAFLLIIPSVPSLGQPFPDRDIPKTPLFSGKATLCPTGWGDRVVAIVAYYTWHTLQNGGNLTLYWPENLRSGNGVEPVNHLKHIRGFFALPPNIVLTSDKKEYLEVEGLDYSQRNPQTLWPPRLSASSGIPIETVRQHLFSNFRIMQPGSIIRSLLRVVPPPHSIGLHLRRGDKVSKERNMKIAISRSQLGELDAKTQAILEEYPNRPIFICSDSSVAAKEYAQRYGDRCVQFERRSRDRFIDVFLDYFGMQRCEIVVISQRYSTFSLTAALSGQAKIHIALPDMQFLEKNNISTLFSW